MNENINCNHKIQFGKRLKKLRQEKGVSQESLALTAGLDRTYVSGCERGLRNIGLENIYKLAIALGISPELLFKDEECENNDA